MRQLDKIEKYLKRFADKIDESERSRYFYLSSCLIRVSDHYSVNSKAVYLTIIIPNNGSSDYVLSNQQTGYLSIVKYEELKGIVKSLNVILTVTPKAGYDLSSLETKLASLENIQSKYDKLKVEYDKFKKEGGYKQRFESLEKKYENVQNELSKVIASKQKSERSTHTVFGVNEFCIPLKIRESIKELIQPYK